MGMEPVTALVQLRNPHIRKRCPTQPGTKTPEEHTDITANLARVMTTLTRVRQRSQPIQPVRGTVPANLPTSPTTRLRFRPLHVQRLAPNSTIPRPRPAPTQERTTRLERRRIQRKLPTRPPIVQQDATRPRLHYHHSGREYATTWRRNCPSFGVTMATLRSLDRRCSPPTRGPCHARRDRDRSSTTETRTHQGARHKYPGTA